MMEMDVGKEIEMERTSEERLGVLLSGESQQFLLEFRLTLS
jgi:hypothetical protein